MTKKTVKKGRRSPFTEEEKNYVFEMITEARAKGLYLVPVYKDLGDSLDSSHFTIKTMYQRMCKEKKDEALELLKAKPIEEVDNSQIELFEEEKSVPSLGQAIEQYTKAVIEEQKEVETPAARVRQIVDVDLYSLVGSQTSVLLQRIEELIEDRNTWKATAENTLVENQKLKDKFMKHLLSD